ncbi:hypothetical protein WJU23_02955 [Prosthecobacter sp. SYSU 5D2]|uniref:hypothetical protein n=1 Tax=Prosthecobacter sp. SYSU 5D2 TaxID=3134134 RepID=UPI0031FEDAA5
MKSTLSKKHSAAWMVCCAGLMCVFTGQVQAQKSLADEMLNDANGTRLEIRSVFDPLPPTGYAPLRIVATNGSSREEVWQLDFHSQTQEFQRSNASRSSLSLVVGPQATQSTVFMASMAPDYGSTTSYRSNSRSYSINLNSPVTRAYSNYDQPQSAFPAIAMTKTLAENSLSGLEDEVEKKIKAASKYFGGANTFGSRFSLEETPEDWLGFSGFDYVMLTDADWQKMTSASRHALLQWTRLGGKLHFYIRGERPASLPPNSKSYGLGQIETFTWNGSKLLAAGTVARYWNKPQRLNTLQSGHTNVRGWPMLDALGKRSFNSWQVIVFLVLFGILVGPVNLFMLAPSGRRHRLFITTPLLSLGASVMMVGIILVQDGIGGIGARAIYLHLEPQEAAAYVTQKQISRTGVLLGAGFEMKQAALVEPLTLPATDWVKLKNTHDMQPVSLTQNGPSRGGNFFQSRAEQAQMIRTAISTRARLEVQPATSAEDPPVLVSALGFTVEEMFYADATGGIWRLQSPLATGQKADLVKVEPDELRQWWNDKREVLKMDGVQELVVAPQNEFFAIAKAAPGFTQETLSSIRWQTDKIIVHGSVPLP